MVVKSPDGRLEIELFTRAASGTAALDRAEFIKALNAENIGTSVHFIPLHLHPVYRERFGFTPGPFPTAYSEYRRVISLPIFPGMTDADVDDVIGAVQKVVRSVRR